MKKTILAIIISFVLVNYIFATTNITTPANTHGLGVGFGLGDRNSIMMNFQWNYGITEFLEFGAGLTNATYSINSIDPITLTNKTISINILSYAIGLKAKYELGPIVGTVGRSIENGNQEYSNNSISFTGDNTFAGIYYKNSSVVTPFYSMNWVNVSSQGQSENQQLNSYGLMISTEEKTDIIITAKSDLKQFSLLVGFYL
ncbi:hypothetical protein ACFL2K_02855 [Candidatus Margulisiibacteriota bacterium]